MPPKYITYRGKQLKVMMIDDAVAEYFEQKRQGKFPAIVSVEDGYIVTEAMFKKPGGEKKDG